MSDNVMTQADIPAEPPPVLSIPEVDPRDLLEPDEVVEEARPAPARAKDPVIDSAQQALQDRDAAMQAARRAAAEAEARAANAEKQLLTQRDVTFEHSIAAAEAKRQDAIRAKQQARDAGNLAEELAADEAHANAVFDLRTANAEKQRWEAEKAEAIRQAQQRQQSPQQQGGPTPEVQRWLAEHPAFGKDPEYTADAEASHNLALRSGYVEGSSAYVNFIDARLAERYGKDHGREGVQMSNQRYQRQQAPQRQEPTYESVSQAAPRSNDRMSNGGNVYYHGPNNSMSCRVQTTRDGKQVVTGQIPGEWAQYARICGMSPNDYALEQMRIQGEMRGGKLTGLAQQRDGKYE